MKNSSDTIGNPTRVLSTCIAVSQPTVPPRAQYIVNTLVYILLLPLALQSAVGFGLSSNILPIFTVTNSLHHR
jgi:hypothetical protein